MSLQGVALLICAVIGLGLFITEFYRGYRGLPMLKEMRPTKKPGLIVVLLTLLGLVAIFVLRLILISSSNHGH